MDMVAGLGADGRERAHQTGDLDHQALEIDWAAIHREKERSLLERAARRVSSRGVDECAGVASSDDGVPNRLRLRF
jgi:hypothetical protein